MNPPEIAAILVNYNAGGELARALRSIADEMVGRSWEAFVVDNASSDGSGASVADFAPMVQLVQNTANVGFSRGVNQGLAVSTAPLVLIMNPDCRLVAGAVATLRSVLDAHPDCAIVGPRILNPDGSVQGSARGDPDMLTGLFGRTALLGRLVPFLPVAKRNVVAEEAIRSGEQSVVVDWLSGACMLARRTALEQVGGFDERFFLYWEDADLCRRLRATRPSRAVCTGRDRHPSRRPVEPHCADVRDPRVPQECVSVLRDARGAGAAEPEARARARHSEYAVLVSGGYEWIPVIFIAAASTRSRMLIVRLRAHRACF